MSYSPSNKYQRSIVFSAFLTFHLFFYNFKKSLLSYFSFVLPLMNDFMLVILNLCLLNNISNLNKTTQK